MTQRKLATKWKYDASEDQEMESFERISNRRVPPELMSTRQLSASLKTAASRRVNREIKRRRGRRCNNRYL